VRASGITLDIQGIPRFDAGRPHSLIDLAVFEEGFVIGRSDRVLTHTYRRRMDGALAVVRSVSLPRLLERCQIETAIENLFNLRHPLITPLIGFVLPDESGIFATEKERLENKGHSKGFGKSKKGILRSTS
jgi:hypothetical protein